MDGTQMTLKGLMVADNMVIGDRTISDTQTPDSRLKDSRLKTTPCLCASVVNPL